MTRNGLRLKSRLPTVGRFMRSASLERRNGPMTVVIPLLISAKTTKDTEYDDGHRSMNAQVLQCGHDDSSQCAPFDRRGRRTLGALLDAGDAHRLTHTAVS